MASMGSGRILPVGWPSTLILLCAFIAEGMPIQSFLGLSIRYMLWFTFLLQLKSPRRPQTSSYPRPLNVTLCNTASCSAYTTPHGIHLWKPWSPEDGKHNLMFLIKAPASCQVTKEHIISHSATKPEARLSTETSRNLFT